MDFMHKEKGAQEEMLGWGWNRRGATGGGGRGKGQQRKKYNENVHPLLRNLIVGIFTLIEKRTEKGFIIPY